MNADMKKDRLRKTADYLSRKPKCKLNETLIQAARRLARVIEIVERVEDVVGTRGLPCPVQSQTAISAIREILGIPACTDAEKQTDTEKPAGRVAPTPISCGVGPYGAKIISANNPYQTLWESPRVYATEDAAVRAVLAKARIESKKNHRWAFDSQCIRHWITERKEHVIDFGSHAYYGAVTGKETI